MSTIEHEMKPIIYCLTLLFSLTNHLSSNAQDELPLTIINTKLKSDFPFIFMISGDGGWTKFDNLLAKSLSEKGFSVIGLDARLHFSTERSPEAFSLSANKVIEQYRKQWDKDKFILLGYSFGADAIPFIANRLNANLKNSLSGLWALSPDKNADFEIKLADILHLRKSKNTYDVLAEFKKVKNVVPICFFGSKESKSLYNLFKEAGMKIKILPGGHHFNYDYEGISESMISELGK